MTDPEREYEEARAAYNSALQRLKAAKAALPPKPEVSPYQQQRQKERAAAWDAYVAGTRNYKALGAMFGHSVSWAQSTIREMREERQLGPPTPWDYAFEMGNEATERGDFRAAMEWFKDMDWRRYRRNRQCPKS